NDPNWVPVWGNVKDQVIQIKPLRSVLMKEKPPALFFETDEKASAGSYKRITEQPGIKMSEILSIPAAMNLQELIKYSISKNVTPMRFAYPAINDLMKNPDSEESKYNNSVLINNGIELSKLIDAIFNPGQTYKLVGVVEWEELHCIGLDYTNETLVATINVKRWDGFSGELCQNGSREYVSFWVDWDDNCNWEYIDTVSVKVYDIPANNNGISYSVELPLNTILHRRQCDNPKVIKIRGVLSWHTAPSTTDPFILETYGNRVDVHVQINIK
ncbi:MAG: hypothetical protein WCL00_01085, partial [Bacteroidota bacterium]